MTAGRTVWWAKDCAWWRRELIVELGEEFGPAGPAVIDWLSCEAKGQNDGGVVKAGYRTVARGSFVDVVTVRHVVSRAVQLGALDDFDEQDSRFTCRISGWRQDQEKGRAAARQAAYREGASGSSTPSAADEQAVTDRDVSRSVTPSHGESPTEQDRSTTPPTPPTGGNEDNVVMFDRRRVPAPRLELAERILAEFNQQAGTGYSAYTGRGRPSEDLKRIISALTDAQPPLDFDEAQRVIAWRLRDPFWEGRPHTGVVFGPKVFAANRESAGRGKSNGATSREIGAAIRSQRPDQTPGPAA